MKALSNSRDCPFCGSNHKAKPFCVYEDGYHCFSCGASHRGNRCFNAKREAEFKSCDELIGDKVYNFDSFSSVTRLFLNDYFVSHKHIEKHHAFELYDGRYWLVMPVIINNEILFYQRRCMNVREILASGSKISASSSIKSDTICIVEDFISYMRVAEHVDALCLFGTKLNGSDLEMITSYHNICVWLDNDELKSINSGQNAAKKICKNIEYTLRLKHNRRSYLKQDTTLYNICTDQDPKYYSDSEIIGILECQTGPRKMNYY